MTNAAELRRVARYFGTHAALDDLSLGIPAGALTAILGPSGCGKTTLLRVLAGLEDPDEGEVIVGGMTVASPASLVGAADRGVGLVFQDLALWPHMTVRQNIEFPLETRERDGARRRRRAEEAAALVSITHRLDVAPARLSGGERQRAALARCLALEPRLLLLDEPFSGLDATLRLRLVEAVAEVRARLGIAAVLVTHDQAEALGAADRVVVLRRGRVAQEGTPRAVYREPRTRFVASFVGLASFLEGIPGGDGTAETAAGPVPVSGDRRIGEAARFALRPEDLALDPSGPLRGTAGRALYRGDGWILPVDTAAGRLLVRCAAAPDSGAAVTLAVTGVAVPVAEDGDESDGEGGA